MEVFGIEQELQELRTVLAMNNPQISILIATLRASKMITPLQKDILDTWDVLSEEPIDIQNAQAQMCSNNISYPDMIATIGSMPGVVYKSGSMLTKEDIRFTLEKQLEVLVAKEMGEARI